MWPKLESVRKSHQKGSRADKGNFKSQKLTVNIAAVSVRHALPPIDSVADFCVAGAGQGDLPPQVQGDRDFQKKHPLRGHPATQEAHHHVQAPRLRVHCEAHCGQHQGSEENSRDEAAEADSPHEGRRQGDEGGVLDETEVSASSVLASVVALRLCNTQSQFRLCGAALIHMRMR